MKETKDKKLRKKTIISYILLAFGIGLISSAIGSYFYGKYMIKQNIHKNVIINNNSTAFKIWLNPPATVIRKYYLFDVQNPDEVEKGIEKPILKERGPYVFSEVWEKKNIEFFGYDIMQYSPVVSLKFEPSLSNGSDKDLITFLNIPAIGMIEQSVNGFLVEYLPFAFNLFLKAMGTKLFVTKTAIELIAGYSDPLMTLANLVLPNLVKNKEFSLINGKNGTVWQNYSMMTGYDDAANVAKIISWDNKQKLDYWYSDSANEIKGTDGTFYAPFLTKKTILNAFNPDMCRSYSLEFDKENIVKDVNTYDFHFQPENFYNGVEKGYCEKECLGNGVQNISGCYGGVSGFISQPHFMNADQKFRDAVKGLEPDKDKHDFVLRFQPNTAVPVTGNIRFQISFYLLQNNNIDLVKHVKPMLFPVVWFDEFLEMDKKTLDQIKEVTLIIKLCLVIPLVLGIIGIIILIIGIILRIQIYHKKKMETENSKIINSDNSMDISDPKENLDEKVEINFEGSENLLIPNNQ